MFGENAPAGLAGSLPKLWNVIRGDMSFVGPRAISPAEAAVADRIAWRRYDFRPGLIHPWWIRQRANIAYTSEAQIDAEYANSQSFLDDVGIALRAVPAFLLGDGVAEAPDRITLLGIPIHNLTMAEAVTSILDFTAQRKSRRVSFVNADCVNVGFRDPEYQGIISASDMVLADGIGIKLAGKLLNQHIRQNVNGTDMLPFLCEEMARRGAGLFLLGGRPGVPEACADWARKSFPGLRISGVQHGYFGTTEEADVIERISRSDTTVLLVAFGVPKQEKWIARHAPALGVGVCMGVGGLLDFYSGRIPRAPLWMRELGLEWIFRFLQEPRRMWKRYFIGNGVFLWRVLQERRSAARK